MIYKSGEFFVGVCLELDERVFEKTAELAQQHIISIAKSYVDLACKNKIAEKQLNHWPQLKYSLIWYLGPVLNRIKALSTVLAVNFSASFTASSFPYGVKLS